MKWRSLKEYQQADVEASQKERETIYEARLSVSQLRFMASHDLTPEVREKPNLDQKVDRPPGTARWLAGRTPRLFS